MNLEKYQNLKKCLADSQFALLEISDSEISGTEDKILAMISLNLNCYSMLLDTIIEQKQSEN